MQVGHYGGPPFPGQPFPQPSAPQFFVPPQPGHYVAPPPPMPLVARRPTPLTVWGLRSSIGAFALPFVGIGLQTLYWRFEPLSLVIMLLAPVAAILGVVLSSIALSGQYTRRGMAIVGLGIGVAGVLVVLAVLVDVLLFA